MLMRRRWCVPAGAIVPLVFLVCVGCARAKPQRSVPPAETSGDPCPALGAELTAQPTTTGLLVVPTEAVLSTMPGDATENLAKTYTVRRGDTLLSIAAAHGTSVEDLMAANSLADADVLRVGQVLSLPALSAGDVVRHVVHSGDTLAQLARRYHTSAAAIAAANPLIEDPERLVIGQVLQIVIGAAPSVRTHVVCTGESVYGIAREYGVPAGDIISANQLSDPDHVTAGQVLVIP